MVYIKRILDLGKLASERSLFLFGPRQSGKSLYIKQQLELKPAKLYNLLDHSLYQKITLNPSLIRQEIEALDLRDSLIVIDEIQKCPALLDEIHLMIEERNLRFLMTGSSARKMRKAGVNLLGGRARDRAFHSFVYPELKDTKWGYKLSRIFNHGLLPFHYLAENPEEDLRAYVGRYLTEEIAAEGIARNIPSFSRFLQVAACSNAQLINYSSIASDAAVSRQTVQNYFMILKDTLLGYELEPFTKSVKRKAIQTAKFYFFDTGIVKTLREIDTISDGSKDFGDFFEHLIFLELTAFIDYFKPGKALHYWRSTSAYEVDFILDRKIAIEVKAATRLSKRDFTGLMAFKEEGLMETYILVCREESLRLENGILIYPWQQFLNDLWAGKIL